MFIFIFILFTSATGYYYIEVVLVDSGVIEPYEVTGRPHNFMEAIYWAVISILTIGYGDITPRTYEGMLFATAFTVIGFITLSWAGLNIVSFIVEGHLSQAVRCRKMEQRIQNLKGHMIICGLGRVGLEIIRHFRLAQQPFVVIDTNEEALSRFLQKDDLFLFGNCEEDDVLNGANVKNAKGLVVATPDDSANVFTVLSAKELNPNLFIIARGEKEETRSKLLRAGADRVVIPSHIGGERMAKMAMHPTIIEFFDQTSLQTQINQKIVIEDFLVNENNALIGKKLTETHIKSKYDVLIIGLKNDKGDFILNPPFHYVIKEGDTLVALGEPDNIKKLHKLIAE